MKRKLKSFLLIGLLLVCILTVVIGLRVKYMLSPKSYDNGAGAGPAAYNYVWAIFKKDYTRAYNSLSPDLAHYPDSVEAFAGDLERINGLPNSNQPCAYIENVNAGAGRAVVELLIQYYDPCWNLDINRKSNLSWSLVKIQLQENAGEWLIISGEDFFDQSWTR